MMPSESLQMDAVTEAGGTSTRPPGRISSREAYSPPPVTAEKWVDGSVGGGRGT